MDAVTTAGSFARNAHEPGQVRKEAAVSGHVLVLEGRPARAVRSGRPVGNDQGQVHGPFLLKQEGKRIFIQET